MTSPDLMDSAAFDAQAAVGIPGGGGRVVVFAADGQCLGRVDGFVVDADERTTHVVVRPGVSSGPREMTIPVGAVVRVAADSLTLDLTTDEVGVLPAVPLQRWAAWRQVEESWPEPFPRAMPARVAALVRSSANWD